MEREQGCNNAETETESTIQKSANKDFAMVPWCSFAFMLHKTNAYIYAQKLSISGLKISLWSCLVFIYKAQKC